jgi:hypothetical protein
MLKALTSIFLAGSLLFAALPSTTNYELNSYGFGSGGTANSSTSNYSLEGITGEISSQPASTSNFTALPGFIQTQQANVPKVTLTNPGSYYDKLKFVIDQQGNPSDALYALQVCIGADWTPSCGGTTMYVKSDNTLGASLTLADYQTYSAWGGAGGANIIGLTPSTTYYLRAKATQGQFTESAYGPSSSDSTVGQSISFCLFAGATCGSGNSTSFSGLVAGTPDSSSPSLGLTFATNADNGGSVYIYSKNGALQSINAPGSPINSATADLATASQGYGAQVSSATALTIQPPYNGSGNNVGVLSTTINTLLASNTPVTGGAATILLQAKPAITTPAATDYSDTVTLIAAAGF